MEHYRLRKYRGPETWARVRTAYEAGESGPSCARRFDVGLANLRKKCRLEGWSRADVARRLDAELVGEGYDAPGHAPRSRSGASGDPELDGLTADCGPPDALAAVNAAVARAASALARGRGGEALTLLKAVESMVRVAGPVLEPPEAREPRPEDVLALPGAPAVIWREAERLADQMLSVDASGVKGAHSAWVYRWRARTLGPDMAAADFAYAVNRGWAAHLWDAEGRLYPPPEPESLDTRMWDQHLKGCAWRTEQEEAEAA